MNYKLVNAVAKKQEGSVIPVVIGYTLIPKDGGLTYYPREVAWELVDKHGSSNCEAKSLEYDGKILKYLLPTDGVKIRDRMIDYRSIPFE